MLGAEGMLLIIMTIQLTRILMSVPALQAYKVSAVAEFSLTFSFWT